MKGLIMLTVVITALVQQEEMVTARRKPTDLQQICFTKNRLAADYFMVCKVCCQSVADAFAFIVCKDVFLQTRNRSAHDLYSLQSLQAVLINLVRMFINSKLDN